MISICVTIKNRSRVKVGEHELLLFPNCVKSIVESARGMKDVELVVADWESTDWPLKEWLNAAARGIPVHLIEVNGAFSRGRGRNSAAAAARGDILLFLDADSILCEAVLTSGLKHLQRSKSYFPVLYSFKEPEHKTGWWRHFGYGNCMVNRKTFEVSGGWPEYSEWGKEDDDFFDRVSSVTEIVREEVPGFFHQWHPEEIEWKDQFIQKLVLTDAEKIKLVETEVRELEKTMKEIEQTIPPGETFILADEDQWNCKMAAGRRVIPFLEKDGQYWGPPSDDQTGISELERLRRDGANFIVFGQPAFWWLRYYSGLNRHLRENFRTILKNDRLVVFDLRP